MTQAGAPAPESQGGWPCARTRDDVAAAGFDPDRLDGFHRNQQLLLAGETSSLAIVRGGVLVHETRGHNVHDDSRFDVWSCTKSFTGLAYLLARADGQLDLEARAYELIPEGAPLTDPRKADITLDHLLTMSAGFAGELEGIQGAATRTGEGMFEYALGRTESRLGHSVAQLARDPGTAFDYSDPGFSHLSLAFAHATGRELDELLAERVFAPLGIERVSWARDGRRRADRPAHRPAHRARPVVARPRARRAAAAAPRPLGRRADPARGRARPLPRAVAVRTGLRPDLLAQHGRPAVPRRARRPVRDDGVPVQPALRHPVARPRRGPDRGGADRA